MDDSKLSIELTLGDWRELYDLLDFCQSDAFATSPSVDHLLAALEATGTMNPDQKSTSL